MKSHALLPLALALNILAMCNASGADIDMCWHIANHIKKGLPNRIDSLTVVNGVTCVPGKGKHGLIYILTVDVASSRLGQKDIQLLKIPVINTWCTEPSMKKLLATYNVTYKYFATDGRFIGNLPLFHSDCRSIDSMS